MKQRSGWSILKKVVPLVMVVALTVNATASRVNADEADTEVVSEVTTGEVQTEGQNVGEPDSDQGDNASEGSGSAGNEGTVTDQQANGAGGTAVSTDTGSESDSVSSASDVASSDASAQTSASNEASSDDTAKILAASLRKASVSEKNAKIEVSVNDTYGKGSVSFNSAKDATSESSDSETVSDGSATYYIPFTTDGTDSTKGTVSFTVKAGSGSKVKSISWNGSSAGSDNGTYDETVGLKTDGETVTVSNDQNGNAGELEVVFEQDFSEADEKITVKQNGSTVTELQAGTYEVALAGTFIGTPDVTWSTSDGTAAKITDAKHDNGTETATLNITAGKEDTDVTVTGTAKVNGSNDEKVVYSSDEYTIHGDKNAPQISGGTVVNKGKDYSDENDADDEDMIISDGNVTVSVTVTDNETYASGIDSVYLQVENADNSVSKYEMIAEENDVYSYTFKEGTANITGIVATDKAGNQQTYSDNSILKKIVIASSQDSGNASYKLYGGSWSYSDQTQWYSGKVNKSDELTLVVALSKYGKLTNDDVKLTTDDGDTGIKPDSIVKTAHFLKQTEYTITYTIPAEKEQNQNYYVSYRKLGWLNTNKITIPVRIDNTAPAGQVTVSYKAEDGSVVAADGEGLKDQSYVAGTGKGKVYINGSFSAAMEIGKDADGENGSGVSTISYGIADENGKEITADKAYDIKSCKCTHDFMIEKDSENSYRFTNIRITDQAGNTTTYKNADNGDDGVLYIADNKKPVIAYTIPQGAVFTEADAGKTESDSHNAEGDMSSDILYFNHGTSGEVSITDHNLDQKAVKFSKTDSYTIPSLSEPKTDADNHVYSYSCADDGDYLFLTEATDLCSNHSGPFRSPHIIVDTKAPEIKVTYNAGGTDVTPAGEDSSFYNKNVTINVQVTDKHLDEKGVVAEITGTTADGAAVEKILTGTLSGGAADNVWAASYVTPADGKYRISVKAVDKATNASDYTGSGFTVDTTIPKVSVAYDNNDAMNEKYYKAERTATITVIDYTFDASKANLALDYSAAAPSQSDWTANGNNTYSKTVKFDSDGHYDFTFTSEDKAGNRSETYDERDFFIDKTAPFIKVAYDNNEVANGRYYKAARNASITISDLTFTPELVTLAQQKQDNAAPLPTLTGFTASSDMDHTAHLSFDQDGNYGYSITCTDLAGNESQVYTSDLFTIDTTAPVVTFSGVENGSANNGTVAPALDYSDKYVDMNKSVVTMNGSNNGAVSLASTASLTENGYRVSYSDFPHTKEMDDLYTLEADVFDMAGNETRQELVFSVNRFGSVYVIDKATAELMKNYYTNKPQDVSITEINVDDLTQKDVSVSCDGDITELHSGRDYIVSGQGSEQSWKSFTYTLKAADFEKDGNYSVMVYSEDRATNKQDNRSRDKEIDFAVDQTPPGIVVSGLENGGVYKESSHPAAVSVTDNMSVTGMQVYLDDKKLASWSADQLNAAGGTENITIPAEDGYQNIRLVSQDIAGNQAEVDYDNVVVSLNTEKVLETEPTPKAGGIGDDRKKTSSGAAAAGTAGIAAIVAGAGFAWRKKKIGIRNKTDQK